MSFKLLDYLEYLTIIIQAMKTKLNEQSQNRREKDDLLNPGSNCTWLHNSVVSYSSNPTETNFNYEIIRYTSARPFDHQSQFLQWPGEYY